MEIEVRCDEHHVTHTRVFHDRLLELINFLHLSLFFQVFFHHYCDSKKLERFPDFRPPAAAAAAAAAPTPAAAAA